MVAPLARRAHNGLGILRQAPLRRSEGFGEAKVLKFLHAADQGGASVCIRSGVDAQPKIDNSIMLRSLAGKRAIELGPTIGLNLSRQIATDLEVAPLCVPRTPSVLIT